MPWEPIAKTPRDRRVEPNLGSYDVVHAGFAWEQARRELDGLPDRR